MPEVDLLAALAAWCREQAESLQAGGVELKCGRTEGDRPKHARFVNLHRHEYAAELIVWETGEAELVARGTVDVDEHHEIASLDQLNELLARLVAAVQAASVRQNRSPRVPEGRSG
jgi:hypothetical protein